MKRQRRDRLMARSRSASSRARQKRRIGERVRLVVDGAVATSTSWCCGAAWRVRRPKSTRCYLTDCDPQPIARRDVRRRGDRGRPRLRPARRVRCRDPARGASINSSEETGKTGVGPCPLFVFGEVTADGWRRSNGSGRWPIASSSRTASRCSTFSCAAKSSGWVVRVFIDKPGPSGTPEDSVGVEDCAVRQPRNQHHSRRRGPDRPCAIPSRCRRPASTGPCAMRATIGASPGGWRRSWSMRAGRRPDGVRWTHRGRRGRRRSSSKRQGRKLAPDCARGNIKRAQARRGVLETDDDQPTAADDRGAREGKGHRARRHHHRHRGRGADGLAQVLQERPRT